MSEPPQPPRPPEFTPGQATPPPHEPAPEYPPTSQFPPVNYAPPGYTPDYGQPPPGGYPQTGYLPPAYPEHPGYPGQPGYGAPPPPRKSNKPLIAVIVAVSLLLCGGVITSGVLLVQRATQEVQEATDEAREAADPYLNPSLPTDLPALPTDLPELPTDLPNLPGLDEGPEITVTYEVTGDGPANIVYAEQLGGTPKVLDNVDLPWKVTTTMKGAAFVWLTAGRGTNDTGSISCRASIDGEEVVKKSAEGSWASTTCTKLVFR
ncbi:MmpS family transport accessory protein [Actinoplanes sp. NPDC024001]|uniref:MmpS family transport accessory protein n=1 Tax=Actinoplanes sp. NPDC024001 TaxID=3154598 RepID=UPI0033D20C54